ncbi:MAG: hypothetical protein HXS53_00925 [Theionarchaea archaeon]|nr:hypothetical protein [Theionarchaea archaeon]
MNRTRWSQIIVVVLGVILLIAGFIPFTKTVVITEEKSVEETEYREELKAREEVYTEEEVVGEEEKEEVLWKDSIPVTRASTMGKEFELKKGDIIVFKAHSDDDMMISFTGQGYVYMSIEIGERIEKEFTIMADGAHTLLYSSASVTTDIVIDFTIMRKFIQPIVEAVEKTRVVEYTERVPYTVEVPIVEQSAREEPYTIEGFRYAGMGILVIGIFLLLQKKKSGTPLKKPKGSRKSEKK